MPPPFPAPLRPSSRFGAPFSLLVTPPQVSVATRREAVDDLVLMSQVDEKSIVAVLKKRFLELTQIYVRDGP